MKRADLTMHGSVHERRLWAIHARQTKNDEKPTGFLSRNTKPSSGREKARPGHGQSVPQRLGVSYPSSLRGCTCDASSLS